MGKKFLVIGSNSFSGAHFIDHALERGNEVVGISRSPEPDPVFLPYKQRPKAPFSFHRLDLNEDLDKIIGLIKKFRPAIIVNFAAQGMVAESWQAPEQWLATNLVSAVKLHDQLRKLDFLEKFIQASTPEVYGACSGTVVENTCYNPSTPYAVSKAAVDMSLLTFHKAYNFPVVFTRAANVYGPGQQLYRIIPRAILSFLTGGKLPLHGGGLSVRSFIHIHDVVEGTMKAAFNGPAGEIYHLSTERTIAIRDLVAMIAGQLNVSFADRVEITDDRPGKDHAYLLDSSKAKNELGWQEKVKLEQGIAETIKWVKDNLEILKKQAVDYIHRA